MPVTGQAVADLLGQVRGVTVVHGDHVACGGERVRDRLADTAGCSCHQHLASRHGSTIQAAYDATVTDDCLFCRIVAGEIPATVVHETDNTLAFRDIDPKAPTHVLVIPRAHHADVARSPTADPALAGEVLATCAAVAEQEGLPATGTGSSSTPAGSAARRSSTSTGTSSAAGRSAGCCPCDRPGAATSGSPARSRPTRGSRPLSVAIHRADRPLWTFTGRRRRRLDAGTQLRIGSVTKTFTAVLVMQCRDEGLLELDDPISRHLPVQAHGDLTVGRLLSHLSGLQREPFGDVWDTMQAPDVDTLLGQLDRAERVLPAGRRFHYSNLAIALLGHLAGRLRGGTWEEVLRERILDPLGLDDTAVTPSRPAVGYQVDA